MEKAKIIFKSLFLLLPIIIVFFSTQYINEYFNNISDTKTKDSNDTTILKDNNSTTSNFCQKTCIVDLNNFTSNSTNKDLNLNNNSYKNIKTEINTLATFFIIIYLSIIFFLFIKPTIKGHIKEKLSKYSKESFKKLLLIIIVNLTILFFYCCYHNFDFSTKVFISISIIYCSIYYFEINNVIKVKESELKYIEIDTIKFLIKDKKDTNKEDDKDDDKDESIKSIWSQIENYFTNESKKESISLMRKYNVIDDLNKPLNKHSLLNIFRLRNYIEILNIIQDTFLDLNKNEKNKQDLISELVYSTKYLYLKAAIKYTFAIIRNLIKFLLFIVSILLLISYIKMDKMLTLDIEFLDMHFFILGSFLLTISIPFGYYVFFNIKLLFLNIYKDSKHDTVSVVIKNLLYLFISIFVTITIITISFNIFYEQNNVEFKNIFHLIVALIFPNLTLEDILLVLDINKFNNDIISILIFFKVFIILTTSLSLIFIIKYFIEKYVEIYDTFSHNYKIPPEFLKFFAYLIVSILTIILVYGTLFINFPKLKDEYKNNQYHNEYNHDKNISYLDQPHNLKFNSLQSSSSTKSQDVSITDYIPLSIFLTFFGAIFMLSTKGLIENYFQGLSLKIDPPYEEGDRVKVDNSEMLSVEKIGFRATTFYGIETNTHLIMPHEKLIKSNIKNYTQPTLDYRREIVINIFENKKNSYKSLPREIEHILLLAAYISTGVKKPTINNTNGEKLKEYIKTNTNSNSNSNSKFKYKDINEKVIEAERNNKNYIVDIYNIIQENIDLQEALFLKSVFELLSKDKSDNESDEAIIKKMIVSIVDAIYDYQEEIDKLTIYIDKYIVIRKNKIFNNQSKKSLKKISKILVNINYYYFYMAKVLWNLKERKNTSEQKKKEIDKVSVELLDVPRVTSKHRVSDNKVYWEISLLVTVELSEQSDEIIQHINMFVDELKSIWNKTG